LSNLTGGRNHRVGHERLSGRHASTSMTVCW
jgi:hypothetical protein